MEIIVSTVSFLLLNVATSTGFRKISWKWNLIWRTGLQQVGKIKDVNFQTKVEDRTTRIRLVEVLIYLDFIIP